MLVVDGAVVRRGAEVGAAGVGARVGDVLVVVAERGDHGDAVPVRVVQCPTHRLADQVLLRGLGGRVLRRAAGAVVQPRVDVEGHVDHVDPGLRGVGEGVDGRLQEEVAAVLAGADLDEVDPRGDAADTHAVEGGRHDARDVRPVPVVVLADGVDAARDARRGRRCRACRSRSCGRAAS